MTPVIYPTKPQRTCVSSNVPKDQSRSMLYTGILYITYMGKALLEFLYRAVVDSSAREDQRVLKEDKAGWFESLRACFGYCCHSSSATCGPHYIHQYIQIFSIVIFMRPILFLTKIYLLPINLFLIIRHVEITKLVLS